MSETNEKSASAVSMGGMEPGFSNARASRVGSSNPHPRNPDGTLIDAVEPKGDTVNAPAIEAGGEGTMSNKHDAAANLADAGEAKTAKAAKAVKAKTATTKTAKASKKKAGK